MLIQGDNLEALKTLLNAPSGPVVEPISAPIKALVWGLDSPHDKPSGQFTFKLPLTWESEI